LHHLRGFHIHQTNPKTFSQQIETPYFFQNGTSYAIKGNRVLFFDSNHISSDVSIDVIEYVKEDLENILKCNNYNVNTANPD
jgi:hypothetical protein